VCLHHRRTHTHQRLTKIPWADPKHNQQQQQQQQQLNMCQHALNVSQQKMTILDESFSQSLKTIGMSYQTLSYEKMAPLRATFTPGPFDVICARGKDAKNHCGNRRFRQKVQDALLNYSKSDSKMEKSMILSDIVESVRRGSPFGGFVKSNQHGQWFEVGDHLAREKVGQSFRDLLHVKYKSSTKSKRKRRRDQVHDMEEESLTTIDQLASSNVLIRQHSSKMQRTLMERGGLESGGSNKQMSDMQVLLLLTKSNMKLLQTLKQDARVQQHLQVLSEQYTTTN
jgi:hypothetical protein